ncbi:MAG: hypothetical protein IMZ71_02495 [Chloroflexi bacterium]|nr:hypothetical protein [Chloroflexota bacterium]
MNLSVFDVIFDAKASRQVARQFPALPPHTELAGLACYPNGLSFYLGRTMTLITADGRELGSNYVLFMLKNRSPWPENLVPLADVETWLATRSTPVFLIVRQTDRANARSVVATKGAVVQELSRDYLGILLPAPGSF